jgi:hypothetical protein
MRLLFLSLLLLVSAWSLPGNAFAFHIHVYGVVTDHFTGEPLRGVQVRMVKDSIEREVYSTRWNGRYEFHLDRGYAYELHFEAEGLVRKFVTIDAREVPLFPDVPFYEMVLHITLFEAIPDVDLSTFDKPVGMAEYKHSVRNLHWNVEHAQARRAELWRVMMNYERALDRRDRVARAEAMKARRKRRLVIF